MGRKRRWPLGGVILLMVLLAACGTGRQADREQDSDGAALRNALRGV